MEPTYEALKARHLEEIGEEGISLSFFVIFAGLALLAFAGLGVGLTVLGVCMFFDGLATKRRGEEIPSAPHRLAGHTDSYGDGLYPPQLYTPSDAERAAFNDEPSILLKFGKAFFKLWFLLWIPCLAVLVALLGS